MAYRFANTTDDINYGDPGIFDGLTALTLLFRVKFAAVNLALGMLYDWSSTDSSDRRFQFGSSDDLSDEILFDVWDTGGSNRWIAKTSDANLTTGVVYALAVTWAQPSTTVFYRDGTLLTVGTTSGAGVASINSGGAGSDSYQIGERPSASLSAADMTVYEVAAWNRVLTAGEIAQLTKYSALFIPRGLISYPQLIRGANDIKAGLTGTVTGATVAVHDAAVVYPSRPRVQKWAAGAALSTTVGRLVNRGLITGGLVGGRLVA